jgi:hypothetical protein
MISVTYPFSHFAVKRETRNVGVSACEIITFHVSVGQAPMAQGGYYILNP